MNDQELREKAQKLAASNELGYGIGSAGQLIAELIDRVLKLEMELERLKQAVRDGF